MNFTALELAGCFIFEPTILRDERGFFMESFNERVFEQFIGQPIHFVQDNQSFSERGVLRGMHYQAGEYAQAKLVRVIQGEVLDVVVDIRPESATYGKHISVLLSDQNKKQLFIPRGFAHGFLVLSDTASFFYKCDNFYKREAEGGIYYADPDLAIDWNFPADQMIISEKDLNLPHLVNAAKVW